jgi:hypothetical protein
MATYYIDGSATTNGDGSEPTPYNTFAGLSWGANTYKIKRGTTLYETVTIGAGGNGCIITAYGDEHLSLPIIDCQNTRTSGVNFNTKVGCELSYVKIINQNAAPSNGAAQLTGSAHKVHHCEFVGNLTSIHVNSCPSCQIYDNYLDVGNLASPDIAYGIRVNNGTGSANNVIKNNLLISSVGRQLTFITSIQIYGASSCYVLNNVLTDIRADGPALMQGASGCYMVGNFMTGPDLLDGLVVDGASDNFIYNNTVIHLGMVEGHSGPAFKMGDNFGAGTPAANNTVKNNIFISQGLNNNVMNLVTIGTGNTFDYNCLYHTNPNKTTIVNYNTGGGTTTKTYAQFQALGFETNGINAAPEISKTGIISSTSPAKHAGVFVENKTDTQGLMRNNPPSMGAYEYFTRAVR